MRIDRDVVDRIDWLRTTEGLVYLFPPVIGVGIVGLIRDVGTGVPGLGRVLILFGTFGYAAIALGLVVALYFDARSLGDRAEWSPRPGLAAGSVLLAAPFALAPFAAVGYLYRRYDRLGVTGGRPGWWLVVGISLGATVFGAIAAVVGIALSIPALVVTGVGLAGAIAFGSFPIAIHRDAAYVARRSPSWQPNPAFYLGIALASLFLAPVQPILATYYLVRRNRAFDRSSRRRTGFRR